MKDRIQGSLLLLLTTVIWGSSFVAQSVGMEYVEPITFNGIRCIIGGIVLIIANFAFDSVKKRNGTYRKPEKSEQKEREMNYDRYENTDSGIRNRRSSR